jgi:hypothetical protein
VSIGHEEAVRAFLLDFASDQLDLDRGERLLSYMAPDARYHFYAWWEPCVGHDAIRAESLKQGTASDNSCDRRADR